MSGTALMSYRKRFRNIDRRGVNTGPFKTRYGRAFEKLVTLKVPLQVTGTSAMPGSLSATVCWTRGPYAKSYTVEKSATGSGGWSVVSSTISRFASCFLVTGLTASVIQYFRVTAVNPAGTGTPSANSSATPTA